MHNLHPDANLHKVAKLHPGVRRIQLALRMFNIPSCEKNATFALFIYTIFKKDKCHL